MSDNKNKLHFVAATAIILKDGKFLILKRAAWEKAFPNKWCIPGGKLERNEYEARESDTGSQQWYNILEDLLRREVLEECGLKIKNIRYVTSLAFIRPDDIPVVTVSFAADYAGGEVRLSDDMDDYAWVTVEEAKEYDLIEGIYEELVMFDKNIKRSTYRKMEQKHLMGQWSTGMTPKPQYDALHCHSIRVTLTRRPPMKGGYSRFDSYLAHYGCGV